MSEEDKKEQQLAGGEIPQSPIVDLTFEGEPYVTLAQFAVIMNKEYHTVRRWVADGQVQAVKIGTYRIYADEVNYIRRYGLRPINSVSKLNEAG